VFHTPDFNLNIMSSTSIPTTTKTWTIEGQDGFDSLKFNEAAAIPKITDNEVLVKFHAASLNYRDLIIPKVTDYVLETVVEGNASNLHLIKRANIHSRWEMALFQAQTVRVKSSQ